jgi:putative sigma-54 modulation protein
VTNPGAANNAAGAGSISSLEGHRMEVQIKTHNLKLSDELRDYIVRRVDKLHKVDERIIDAKFELRVEPHHHPTEKIVAQFTIATKRSILRAEDRNSDLHAVVDMVTDRMARQIRRFHDRKVFRDRRVAVGLGELAVDQLSIESATVGTTPDGQPDETIVRTKSFPVHPMDSVEAVEQMELLGHDFYVFFNADTSQINVLYRRKEGGFGILVPELE